MDRKWLWALAILALAVPYSYMSSGGAKAMSGAAKLTLINMMRNEAMVLDSQLDSLLFDGLQRRAVDAALLKDMADRMNAQYGGPIDPAAAAQMKKESGIDPDRLPKFVPFRVAPAREPRTLSLGIEGPDLVIQGWGMEPDKPIFEKRIKGVAAQ